MRNLIIVLALALVLTGCDQRADYEAAAQACVKNNGIIVKTLSFSKTYLFGVVPIGTTMAVYCQVNPTVGSSE